MFVLTANSCINKYGLSAILSIDGISKENSDLIIAHAFTGADSITKVTNTRNEKPMEQQLILIRT